MTVKLRGMGEGGAVEWRGCISLISPLPFFPCFCCRTRSHLVWRVLSLYKKGAVFTSSWVLLLLWKKDWWHHTFYQSALLFPNIFKHPLMKQSTDFVFFILLCSVAFLSVPNMKTKFPVTMRFVSDGRRERLILETGTGKTWKRNPGWQPGMTTNTTPNTT